MEARLPGIEPAFFIKLVPHSFFNSFNQLRVQEEKKHARPALIALEGRVFMAGSHYAQGRVENSQILRTTFLELGGESRELRIFHPNATA